MKPQTSNDSSEIRDPEVTNRSSKERESTNLQRLKHVSYSVPVISINEPIESETSGPVLRRKLLAAGTRQKKFCSYFKPLKDQLLEYYACAFTGEGLFQGHMYITANHFAFYSHVLGFTKKVLIPVQDIIAIEKEYTAKFIPNAISISVSDKKHFFASFISRDAAHRVLYQVWEEKVGPRNNDNNQEDYENEDLSGKEDVQGNDTLKVEDSFGLNSDTGSDSAEPESTPAAWTSSTPTTSMSIEDTTSLVQPGSEPTSILRLRPRLHRMHRISVVSIKDACERGLVNPVKENTGLITKVLICLMVVALFASSLYLLLKISRLQAVTGPIYSNGDKLGSDLIDYQSETFDATKSKSIEVILKKLQDNLKEVKNIRLALETLESVNS